MEFYITFVDGSCTNMCFNSQRDGILPKNQLQGAYDKMFQFPTGWNSTFPLCSLSLFWRCFNSQRDEILRIMLPRKSLPLAGFNSQRDEILRRLICPPHSRSRVSIPNGMKFYEKTYLYDIVMNLFQFPTGWNSTLLHIYLAPHRFCFNSQRDEILRVAAERWHERWQFQFPTGWNSTHPDWAYNVGKVEFQFPTGWNSTRLE